MTMPFSGEPNPRPQPGRPVQGPTRVIPGTGGPVNEEPTQDSAGRPAAGGLRNLGRQFKDLATPGTDAHKKLAIMNDQWLKAGYFHHAGFGAALRHTLGLPQTPSHVNDYIRSRTHGNKRGENTGEDPSDIHAEPTEPGPGPIPTPGYDPHAPWRTQWQRTTGQDVPPGEQP
jgi:hypothetical protein